MSLKPRRGFLRPPSIDPLVHHCSDQIKRSEENRATNLKATNLEAKKTRVSLSFYQKQQHRLQDLFIEHHLNEPKQDDRWPLPNYTNTETKIQSTAINYQPKNYIDIKDDDIDVSSEPQLTPDEIEQIKAEAYQEGFEQGQQAGHALGIEQGQPIGIEQGFQKGKEQGFQEGFISGQALAQQQIDQLTNILEQLVTPLQQVDLQVEQQMLSIVMALSKELITTEFKTNSELLLQVLHQSIQALPEKEQQIVIYLNKQDLELIKQYYNDETLQEQRWQLRCDPMCSIGDLRIESGYSTVEYELQQKITELFHNFIISNQKHKNNYTPETITIERPQLELSQFEHSISKHSISEQPQQLDAKVEVEVEVETSHISTDINSNTSVETEIKKEPPYE